MPILSLSFPADPLAPPKTVDWLAEQYRNARMHRIHYTEEGNDPGHFGYFRPPFKNTLWNYTHRWIGTGKWNRATAGGTKAVGKQGMPPN